MSVDVIAEETGRSPPSQIRWDVVGLALVLTLGLTDLELATAGGTPVTVFLVVGAVVVPRFLVGWSAPIDWFGARAVAAWMALNFALNLQTSKTVSVVYSFVFLAAYVTMMNCQRFISKEAFARVLRIVIALYFANVVVSQLLVFVGAPDFLASFFHRAIDTRENVGLRYYGFSSEPSYAAFIVVACFVSLRQLTPASQRRQLWIYGGLVAWQLWAFASVYGYLLGILVALAELYRSVPRQTFYVVLSLLLAAGFVKDCQGEGRFEHLVTAAINQEVEGIADLHVIDSSLFLRVAPAIEYVESADFSNPAFFVGHGAMSSTDKYTDMFAGWIGEDESFMASFLPGYFYDFGLIGGVLVLMLILRRAGQRRVSLPNLVLAAVVFNASFNTQLFWFVVGVFAMTNLYARGQDDDAGA